MLELSINIVVETVDLISDARNDNQMFVHVLYIFTIGISYR